MIRIAVICITLLVSEMAYSDNPTPPPIKTAEKTNSDVAKKEKKPEADLRGTKEFPAVIEISPSSAIKMEAKNITVEHHDYFSSEWWLVYLTAALALITGFLALYTARLWRATVNLARDAKATSDRQAAEMQQSIIAAIQSGNAIERVANASRAQAEIIRDQYSLMEDTAIRQLRAYIAVETTQVPNMHGDRMRRIGVSVKNIGQTPASNVKHWTRSAIHKNPHDAGELAGGVEYDQRGIILYPGVEQLIVVIWPAIRDEEERTEIIAGAKAIYVWGEIIYTDAFGYERSTKFKFFHCGEGVDVHRFANYPEGNEAT